MSLIILFGSVSFALPVLYGQNVSAAGSGPSCTSGELIGDSNFVQIILSCPNLEYFASTGTTEFDDSYKNNIKLHPGSRVAYPYNASIAGNQLTLYFNATDGTLVRNLVIDAGILMDSYGDVNDAIIISSSLIIDHHKPNIVEDGYDILGAKLDTIGDGFPGVLFNDSDAEGLVHDAVVVEGLGPTHGTVVLQLDGSFVYTPAKDYYGPDSFTYSASDVEGNSNTAIVHIYDQKAEFSSISFYSDGLNSGYAKVGDTVRVDFTTNEPVTVDSITIAGKDVIGSDDGTHMHFSAECIMQESDSEGSIVYSISVRDYANHSSSTTNSDIGDVIIFDQTAPVIDISETDMTFEIHEEYEESATVTDNGVPPVALSVSGSVNTDVPGYYEINYDAVDMAGNQAETATRTVTVIDSIALDFDEISNNLAAIGIDNNLSEVTTDNVTEFTNLYFEKSVLIDGVMTKIGRITFKGPLDLTDNNLIDFFYVLGEILYADTPGSVGIDFRGVSDLLSVYGMEATIKFYGLDVLGYDNFTDVNEVLSKLDVFDDDGNRIDQTGLIADSGIYVGCNDAEVECYTFTVGVNHFSRYTINSIDKIAPVVTGVTDGTYYNVDVTITFTDDNLDAATLNGNPFTYGTVVSAEGDYILIVTDLSGNTTTVNFTVDKTDPVVTINKPADIKKGGKVVISGTIDDLTGTLILTVGNKIYTITSENIVGTDWSYTVDTKNLSAGTYAVKITATDLVGNVGVDTTRLKINSIVIPSIVIPHNDNPKTPTKPVPDIDFNPSFVIRNSFSQDINYQPVQSTQDTLGVSTVKVADKTVSQTKPVEDEQKVSSGWNNLFGVMWYWWVLIGIVLLLTWWIFIG